MSELLAHELDEQGPAPAEAQEVLEVEIAAIWRRLLGRQSIGIDDDFFDSGEIRFSRRICSWKSSG